MHVSGCTHPDWRLALVEGLQQLTMTSRVDPKRITPFHFA
jgi:hypothetical protein